ncbi:chorismate mutase protein [Rutstroemia sp. NJR-2017a WRK4]|nr:chorismate mutase protein [Rutstroemia sp. NJR-2017a WRK4]
MAHTERRFINGFPAVADLIASDPDHSASVYRCFHRLSSRNLLYIEAELLRLEKQQDDLDLEDSFQDPGTLQCFRSWEMLCSSQEPRQKKRVELIMKIQEKLKEYHIRIDEALVLQKSVLEMAKPQTGAVNALRSWLKNPNMCHAPAFSGLGAKRLEDEADLVALHPTYERDWLMKFAQLPYIRLFFLVIFFPSKHSKQLSRTQDSRIDGSIAQFSMKKMERFAAILSMIIAGALLIGAILALYFITNNGVRLALIGIFMVVFAASLHFLTNARRTEVFASTAAYDSP